LDDLFSFDGAEDLSQAWRDGLMPDPALTVSEWADRHRVLSPRASAEPGRYRTDRSPQSLPIASVDAFWTDFEAEADRRRHVYEQLREQDLERRTDYLGTGTYSVARLVRTHAAHFTGHTWQIRYVRGTYARATGREPEGAGLP